MTGRWREVARLRFKGERFRDHALDLTALTELRQFQRIVGETAKALWRAAHPDRERLPAHFEERTRLCVRRIEEGSAVTPLEVYLEEPDQSGLWEPEPQEVTEAISIAYKVLDSVERDQPLPPGFPTDLLPEYIEWGRTLGPDEEVELTPSGDVRRRAKVSSSTRERLAQYAERRHITRHEVIGEVLEADVRQRKFQLWTDARTAILVNFDAAQEDLVTSALRDHRSVKMLVRGVAEVSPQGKPIRFTEVEALRLIRDEDEYDANAPRIEDVLAKIASRVPAHEWRSLPDDLTDHLDRYLYGE